jgi:hypothetical protein
MVTWLDHETTMPGASRERAERLAETFAAPQDELAGALCAARDGADVEKLGKQLSPEAVQLLSAILPRLASDIAGVSACLAAAAGVDPLATAARLLATGEIREGEYAVRVLLISKGPGTAALLRQAAAHARYHVRRLALCTLVKRAEAQDRVSLAIAANDRSAEVRLTWTQLMTEYRWPEALDSLVRLLRDKRDFNRDYISRGRPSWKQYCVARSAAHALRAYGELSGHAIDALLDAAADSASDDPFVACAALSALALKDDTRIPAVLHTAVFSPGLLNAAEYRPVPQAASWAIFDRARAGKVIYTDSKLLATACEDNYEIACPLLMAYGALGGSEREILLSRLRALGLEERAELVLLAAAMIGHLPAPDSSGPRCLLAKLAAGERLSPTQQEKLETWSSSLDSAIEIHRYAAWIASTFDLPVQNHTSNARSFRLPERVTVITGRTHSQVREESASPDDGL